jgi:hypothetical protein
MAMLGGMFGINGDGKVSCMEKVVGYGFSGRSWASRRRGAAAECFAGRAHNAYPAGREVEDDLFTEVERSVNLIIAGLDENDLRAMNSWDRWDALEEAGLDPEDYDYLAE